VGDLDNLVINPAIVFREELDDWGILFNPDSDSGFCINPVGVLICKLLNGRRTFSEIIWEVRQNCEGETDNVEKEVEEFLRNLVLLGFVGKMTD